MNLTVLDLCEAIRVSSEVGARIGSRHTAILFLGIQELAKAAIQQIKDGETDEVEE